MNRIRLLLILLPGAMLTAQSPAPDRNALKAQLDAREQRCDLLLDEIRAADSRIEDRIDELLRVLRSVGDSKDSRTKIARMKEQTIDALQKNLDYFDRRRASLLQELRNPRLLITEEEKRRAVTKFNERIEKRIRQILDLSKSLPTHKDYEQYKTTGGGWYGTNQVENEDYKQNKRLTAHTNTQRDEIIKELQRGIDRLDRQNRTLRSGIQTATTDAQRKALTEEIAKNEALAKARRAQLVETLTPSETRTRPIGLKEAMDLDKALLKAIDALRRDFTSLFQRYSSYVNERSSVNAARAALDAAGRR